MDMHHYNVGWTIVLLSFGYLKLNYEHNSENYGYPMAVWDIHFCDITERNVGCTKNE